MRFGILIGLALYSVIDRNEQAAKQNREKERGLVLIVCSITMIFLCCHLPRYISTLLYQINIPVRITEF